MQAKEIHSKTDHIYMNFYLSIWNHLKSLQNYQSLNNNFTSD